MQCAVRSSSRCTCSDTADEKICIQRPCRLHCSLRRLGLPHARQVSVDPVDYDDRQQCDGDWLGVTGCLICHVVQYAAALYRVSCSAATILVTAPIGSVYVVSDTIIYGRAADGAVVQPWQGSSRRVS